MHGETMNFGTTFRSHLQGSISLREMIDAWIWVRETVLKSRNPAAKLEHLTS